MNTHRLDFSVRNTIGYAALAAAASLTIMFVVSSVAHSKEVKIGGLHSKDSVRAACANAGGTSWSTSGRFGCVNNSKGTSVTCTNGGECTGEVPGRTKPGDSPQHVLTGSPGLAATSSAPPPAKSGGLLGDGILGGGMGLGTIGPAATGSPVSGGSRAPAAAPIQLR
jgi:hypothetical protein